MTSKLRQNQNDARYCLLLCLTVFSVLSALYASAFVFQLDAPVDAWWRLRNMLYVKEELASSQTDSRYLIIGASSTLHGIDGAVISEITGSPVLNLGVAANMGLEYMAFLGKKYAKPGDVVVLPLDYPFYHQTDSFDTDHINNILAWGGEFRETFTFFDWLTYFFKTSPKRVVEGVLAGIGLGTDDKWAYASRQRVLNTMNRTWTTGKPKNPGYTHLALSRHGDFIRNFAQTDELKQAIADGDSYIRSDDPPDKRVVDILTTLRNDLDARKARFVLTWPVSAQHHAFDLTLERHRNRVIKLRTDLERAGLDIYCNPASFHFSPEFFWDTVFHLNSVGARLRSQMLADCLKAIDANDLRQAYDFEDALAKVKELQEEARPDLSRLR